jgi:hypothetical protein
MNAAEPRMCFTVIAPGEIQQGKIRRILTVEFYPGVERMCDIQLRRS